MQPNNFEMLITSSNFSEPETPSESFRKNEEIRIGDWCAFEKDQQIFVGLVLSFARVFEQEDVN